MRPFLALWHWFDSVFLPTEETPWQEAGNGSRISFERSLQLTEL